MVKHSHCKNTRIFKGDSFFYVNHIIRLFAVEQVRIQSIFQLKLKLFSLLLNIQYIETQQLAKAE